ncbi:MAG: phosphatidylserine decarboxylase [Gemmatimonadaceae bacterium]|nr:phosphatidylserine decarboxylase [Gemmatimonadaceae bacterium]
MPLDLAARLQYLWPKRTLTVLAGQFASARAGALTTAVIRRFVSVYGVNMSEAEQPDVSQYATFNAFFTRALTRGARPIAASGLVSPVDGAVSQLGRINGDQIFQAKGHHYALRALVGGDAELAAPFVDGLFATIYLSPKDYHRIHMPCDGRLVRMVYVPGALFSVNPATARTIPGLFARNERVVCCFESARGPFVMVLVGATIVGSMATTWHGVVNPPRSARVREWRYDDQQIVLRQGEEMGQFLLGSTVVLLFKNDTLAFDAAWSAGRTVRMGEAMARALPDTHE